MTPLFDRFDDDRAVQRQVKSSSSEELALLEEYLAHTRDREPESASYELDSDRAYMAKRDALWTTTEVLDCVRRLKMYQAGSKLDRITEMLNCYRRLKHSG